MALFTLPKFIQNVLVVGPIYNKLDKLEKIKQLMTSYDWIVFNDSITYNIDICSDNNPQIKLMDQLLSSGKATYNIGKIDLLLASKLNIFNSTQSKIESWIRNKPNVVKIDFNSSFQLLVVSGGIPVNITKQEQLESNIEISFMIHCHQTYTGGLGYVISNFPLTQSAPTYYRYSSQIGNAVDGQVYALEINRNGVQKTILI